MTMREKQISEIAFYTLSQPHRQRMINVSFTRVEAFREHQYRPLENGNPKLRRTKISVGVLEIFLEQEDKKMKTSSAQISSL